MKSTLSWIGMPCAPLLLGLALSEPSGAVSVVLSLDLEPQYASRLCWAAADTIAVNSFFNSCPVGASPGQTSQARDAAYHILGITALSAPAADATEVASQLSNCETNIQACNNAGVPILLGLTSTTMTATGNASVAGLSWSEAKQQIDGGHPFLFTWAYPSSTSKSKPSGLHQLVAIGYSTDSGNKQLVIWDPWPVPETANVIMSAPGCGPLNPVAAPPGMGHLKFIDFSVYTDPQSDMGVAARHDTDQYDLALATQPNPPTNVQVGDPTPAKKVKLSPKKKTGGAAMRKFGVPFPIVGLGDDQLSRSGPNLTGVLTQPISAVLFPVEARGRVVDSFLMLLRNGKWQRGGYANTEITRLLVQARLRYAEQHHLDPQGFYMASAPGLVAFFVAHGYGNAAVLIPASSDPLIHAVAGVAVPAATQLGYLAAALSPSTGVAPISVHPAPTRGRLPIR